MNASMAFSVFETMIYEVQNISKLYYAGIDMVCFYRGQSLSLIIVKLFFFPRNVMHVEGLMVNTSYVHFFVKC